MGRPNTAEESAGHERIRQTDRIFGAFLETMRALRRQPSSHDSVMDVAAVLAKMEPSTELGIDEDRVLAAIENYEKAARLAKDDWPTWAWVFRRAIEMGFNRSPYWRQLKCCFLLTEPMLVVMTKQRDPQMPKEIAEEIVFSGDTRGLLGSLIDGRHFSKSRHQVLDGCNIFIFLPDP